jgi:hypothetical protein
MAFGGERFGAKDSMAKNSMTEDEGAKEKILAAIRRAAAELGRAPSRGELRRITGVSHYRVLAEFPTLREAVRAAGLEPNPKGEKISTEDLLADWKRVAEKLGRRPSRAEYVREGKYSAGALTVRFGSWGNISTTEATENHRDGKSVHRGDAETGRKPGKGGREASFVKTGRKTRMPENSNHKGHEGTQRRKRSGDPVIGGSGDLKTERVAASPIQAENHRRADILCKNNLTLRGFDRAPLAAVPAPLVGMRKVTEAVAQMVVNTLLVSNQQSALSIQPGKIYHGDTETRRAAEEGSREASFRETRRRTRIAEGEITQCGVDKSKPVMGEPFDRSPMTNAPVNELGVMVLFGMVAARLGLQVESVQGKFPDCVAKRQVAPGKWQHLRIEFEYESKNFKLHGHDPKGCDMIVCWRHNWKDCPEGIEVVELSRMVGSN